MGQHNLGERETYNTFELKYRIPEINLIVW